MAAKKEKKKSLYTLTEVDTNRSFSVYIMQSVGYKYENAIIKYESIDEDGAEVVNAGKLLQDIPITIYLIDDMKANLEFIKKLRDTKESFTLFSNIDSSNIFGTYILQSIDTTITDGSDALLVNVTLTEFKKASIRKRNFVLPVTKDLTSLLNFLKNQNQIDKR